MSRTLSPYQPRPIGFYASRLRPDALVIFLFHGVVCRDETRLRNYTRKHVERDYFAAVLHDLRAAGQPLSMPEAAAIALSGRDYPPRSFAITFDDGFENNLSVAAPVLADLALPATFYVTSDYVQHNIMSWTDRLECALEGAAPCSLRLPWESSSRQIDGVEAGIALMEELRRRVKGDRGIDADSLIADLHRQAGLVETWQAEKVSIWHAGTHDNAFGQRLTCLMIAKKLPDAAVPMSLLADHPNVQFNYYRKGLGTCAVEMH